ncbi:apolipoprotein L3 [Fukomys damarensis]|uniref:Apolipoprotein L3 n=1 Tax=Fukomys damarensis TaxID=885580 RepID=A0A091CP17_FUKDA|nr:apolipoprotein L3 [Fukomys damarensis]KFO18920.1 Apolipoprotein L3 [Fukomys damarensis]
MLHKALYEHAAARTREDRKELQEALEVGKKFLKIFPQIRECIEKIRGLAAQVDKTHRGCTVSNVVASSAGAVSGVMTMMGLLLAPFTAGGSLTLSAAGMGLGAATAATGVATIITEESVTWWAKAEANRLLSASEVNLRELLVLVHKIAPKVIPKCKKCISNWKKMMTNIRARRAAIANPSLARDARRLTTPGALSPQRAQEVQRAFTGTALTMTKASRIMGVVSTGFSLGVDVYNLVKDLNHLREGAEAESARELWQMAQELEAKLEGLSEVYNTLQSALDD